MINRSVAEVVCPVAGAHYPMAGVILTVIEENHPVAVVACPVARVMQTCVAQVTSKSTVIGSLVDCPFACRIVADHSLMSGVMHSLAGIMDRKADCVQSVACLFTIHAAVWKFQHYTCQWMCTFSGMHFRQFARGKGCVLKLLHVCSLNTIKSSETRE